MFSLPLGILREIISYLKQSVHANLKKNFPFCYKSCSKDVMRIKGGT
jgi:hypothetical protein